jgi:hypothetical protein
MLRLLYSYLGRKNTVVWFNILAARITEDGERGDDYEDYIASLLNKGMIQEIVLESLYMNIPDR